MKSIKLTKRQLLALQLALECWHGSKHPSTNKRSVWLLKAHGQRAFSDIELNRLERLIRAIT